MTIIVMVMMMMISSHHQQRGELVDGSIPWPLIAFNSSWWFLMETIFKHQMLSICWNKFEDQSHVSLSALPSYFYFWVFLIPLTFDLNPGPDLSLSWCWRSSFVSSRHLQSERWSLFHQNHFLPHHLYLWPCFPFGADCGEVVEKEDKLSGMPQVSNNFRPFLAGTAAKCFLRP